MLSQSKPKTYSLCRLSMVTSIVCGLEFCASVALSYVPSMLLKVGLKEQEMTLIMGLGPFFGFFFCPFIGKMSDSCTCKYGRRKPFIFALSLAILVSLSVIYYSQILIFSYKNSLASVCLLVFACVLLDFSSQASFNPIESLLLDMCQGTDREHTCFTVYSFMNSLGGCLGYLITGISWNSVLRRFIKQPSEDATDSAAKRELDQERSVFAILGVLYAFFAATSLIYANDSIRASDEESLETQENRGVLLRNIKKCSFRFLFKFNFVSTIIKMPDALKRLALADCSCWTALMCFTLFYMDYVGQIVFEGDPSSPSGTVERVLYDEGIRAASWGLLYHCLLAMIYACFISKLIQKLGLTQTWYLSMCSFTIAMFLMLCTRNIFLVNFLASLTGIALASLTTVPYTLITLYHSNKKVYYSDLVDCGRERGVGGDMAMLDSAYFLAQIILSLTISYVVHLTGTAKSYIYTAAFLSLFGIFCIKRIKLQ